MAGNNKGTNFEEILDALDGAPQGLDADSLVAVLALTNCMEVDTAQFVYCKAKDEENKTGE